MKKGLRSGISDFVESGAMIPEMLLEKPAEPRQLMKPSRILISGPKATKEKKDKTKKKKKKD